MFEFLNNVKLKPVDVTIEGIAKKVPMQRFTMDEWENHIAPVIEGKPLEVAVLYLMNPPGYEHKDEDLIALKKAVGVPEILKLYSEGLRVNGCVVGGAEQEAKKN